MAAGAVPKSGEYLEGKLWFERKGKILTLGLTGNGIEGLGSIESVDLPEEGESFDVGDVLATVDGTHGQVEVTAPADSVIVEVNSSLISEPEVLAEDPLEAGWLVKIEVKGKIATDGVVGEVEDEESDDDDDDDQDEDEEVDLDELEAELDHDKE